MTDGMTPDGHQALQDELARALRAYGAQVREHGRFPPFRPEHQVTATDAVIAASAILRAADVELFELSMWEAMGST